VAVATKSKILLFFVTIFLTVAGAASILVYMLTSDIDVNIAHNPNSIETQEANRKLKVFNEALAGKKPGFIRLNQAEINGFLQSRYAKQDKNKANPPVQLLKAGLLLRQTDLTFITWHKVTILGMDFPVVVQDHWKLSKEYGIFATPVAFLIDRNGTVARDVARGVDQVLELGEHALAGTE